MAQHTSRLFQGVPNSGNFYNIEPWFYDYHDVGDGPGDALSGFFMTSLHGVSYDEDEWGSPFREIIFTVQQNRIVCSTDVGRTWFTLIVNGGGYFPSNVCHMPKDISPSSSGSSLISVGSTAYGFTNLDTLFGTSNTVTVTGHSFSNMGTASDLRSYDGGLRLAHDHKNNRWYAAGYEDGTDNCMVVWRGTSTALTSTGGWTQGVQAGLGPVRNIAFGGSGLDEALVVTTADGGSEPYNSHAGIYGHINANSPAAPTVVDLSGTTTMVFRGVVYNKFWDTWLFVDQVTGEDSDPSGVMRCRSGDIGSSDPTVYDFFTSYNDPTNFGSLEINDSPRIVDINGHQGTIGPWSYFQTLDRGVLATPDVGNTWYYTSVHHMDDPSNLMSGFGVTQVRGCIAMNFWDTSANKMSAYKSGSLAGYAPFANPDIF